MEDSQAGCGDCESAAADGAACVENASSTGSPDGGRRRNLHARAALERTACDCDENPYDPEAPSTQRTGIGPGHVSTGTPGQDTGNAAG